MSELEMKIEALIRCMPQDAYNKALREVSENNTIVEAAKTDKLDDVIRDALREIGMPNTIKGYDYARVAIASVVEDPSLMHNICKGMYVKVAKDCNTTPSRAERAIRHGIENAWNRYGCELREEYFDSISHMRKGNPTNSEFIGGMAEIVRMKMR